MTQNAPGQEPWGRIGDDGTVYVRTAAGERAIGSWQAGSVDEGLAYYRRRYDDLAAEVAVLEGRFGNPTVDPRAVTASAHKLKDGLATATVVGDIGALDARLDAVVAHAEQRVAERTAQRAEAAAEHDLLISDIELPDGTGLELMRELGGGRGLPGIAMSGFGSEEDVRLSREAGFATHLTKPIDIARLESAIQEFGPGADGARSTDAAFPAIGVSSPPQGK